MLEAEEEMLPTAREMALALHLLCKFLRVSFVIVVLHEFSREFIGERIQFGAKNTNCKGGSYRLLLWIFGS